MLSSPRHGQFSCQVTWRNVQDGVLMMGYQVGFRRHSTRTHQLLDSNNPTQVEVSPKWSLQITRDSTNPTYATVSPKCNSTHQDRNNLACDDSSTIPYDDDDDWLLFWWKNCSHAYYSLISTYDIHNYWSDVWQTQLSSTPFLNVNVVTHGNH